MWNSGSSLRTGCIATLKLQDRCVSMESSSSSPHAAIRAIKDDEDLKITFFYDNQQKDLIRKKNDTLGKTLQRIALKLQPKSNKKKKKKNSGVTDNEKTTEDIACCVLDSDVPVSEELSNEKSFLHGHVLQINKIKYAICVNPPTVTHLSLPNYIMAGFPIIPKVKFESGVIENSKFRWLKRFKEEPCDWTVVGEQSTYVPGVEDIDFYLKCICYPANGTVEGPFHEESISEELVKAGPGPCLFDERHLYTQCYHSTESSGFRVITYNILANMLADTDYARTELFPFCPPYAIKIDYRRQLLFKELIGYHGDIVCLQECTFHEYDNYLEHWMTLHGYSGFLKLKLGEMSEGEALFYRKERYQHIADLSTSIEEALFKEANKPLLDSISCAPALLENLLTKKNIGQIHLLRESCGEGRYICVLNTHLFYKRYASHIRLLQVSILLNHLSDALRLYEENIPVIVAGDFNALQGEPLLDYLSGNHITGDHLQDFKMTSEPSGPLPIDLKCPLDLKSLSGNPAFTSYVPHCKATLDYIYGDGNFVKEGFVPMPKASDIDLYTGVPCIVYPSDHFAVVLDLKWNS